MPLLQELEFCAPLGGFQLTITCDVVFGFGCETYRGIRILKIRDIQTNRKRKLNESVDYNEKKSRTEASGRTPLPESGLWVDKHRPKTTKQIIGQQGDKSCVNKLLQWLSDWHKNFDKKPGFGKYTAEDGAGYKAALLSGAPGVGKTTTAQLVCKELGYEFIELNASDARSKRTLEEVVKELLKNTTLTSYFGTNGSVSSKHVVVMDEVDGMAGNEDRGGIAELILLIKSTKVPIICICNDRSHPKMRSLVNYCFDLRFFRPRVEQIKGPMMSIAYKEGITIAPNVLHELIVSSNHDIRQVLHNLSLLSTGHKRIDNLLSEQSIKDVKMGPFDAVRKVFTAGEEYARMSFQDKSDLFFCDYSIMPLFNFENYCHVNPHRAKSESQKLKLAMKSIEAMAFGDLIEKQIRSTNNWSLLPLEAAFSSVMPGAYMSGHLSGMIGFPSFMGKLSTTNKRNRLLQELKMHMNLKVSGSKTALNLDYLEPLRDSIIQPLINNGTGGVPTSMEKLENYCLRREDIESITELTLWNNQTDPMSKVDSKVKAALTRAYNKEGFCLPYSFETTTKGKKTKTSDALDEFNEGEERADDETNTEEDDDIAADAMIKPKKKTAKKEPKKTGKESKKGAKDGQKNETKKKPKKETKTEETEVSDKKKPKSKKESENTSNEEKKISPKKSKEEISNKDSKKESKVSPKKPTEDKLTNGSKKKTKRIVLIESDSESEEVIAVSPKKVSKSETNSKKTSENSKREVKKSPKESVKEEPKNETKNKSKNETKSPSNSVSTEKKSKSDTKAKKTPENNKKDIKSEQNSGSKGKQLTINSFFKKK